MEWNNTADDDVEQYKYDFYYDNCKSLDVLEEDFLQFFKEMVTYAGSELR